MRYIKVIIITIVCCALFGAGFYAGMYLQKSKEIVVTKSEPVYNVVYRDYSSMTIDDYKTELQEYDSAPFLLDGEYNNGTFTARASLKERSVSRDFVIDVGTSGDWRMYVGIGAVGLAAGMAAALYLSR